jgi:hypothetical protein
MASLEEAGELGLPDQGLKRTLKDLFAGAVGGVAQVLLGMFILEHFMRGWRCGAFMGKEREEE